MLRRSFPPLPWRKFKRCHGVGGPYRLFRRLARLFTPATLVSNSGFPTAGSARSWDRAKPSLDWCSETGAARSVRTDTDKSRKISASSLRLTTAPRFGEAFLCPLFQSQLLHLLANLVFAPAKKARGLCHCPAVGDLVP